MTEMWNISSNPHIRDKRKSSDLMSLVLIALLPATIFGVINFGIDALNRAVCDRQRAHRVCLRKTDA